MIKKLRDYADAMTLQPKQKIDFYKTPMYFLGLANDRRLQGVKKGVPEILCLKEAPLEVVGLITIRAEDCFPGRAKFSTRFLRDSDRRVKIYNEIVGGNLQ